MGSCSEMQEKLVDNLRIYLFLISDDAVHFGLNCCQSFSVKHLPSGDFTNHRSTGEPGKIVCLKRAVSRQLLISFHYVGV